MAIIIIIIVDVVVVVVAVVVIKTTAATVGAVNVAVPTELTTQQMCVPYNKCGINK